MNTRLLEMFLSEDAGHFHLANAMLAGRPEEFLDMANYLKSMGELEFQLNKHPKNQDKWVFYCDFDNRTINRSVSVGTRFS